MRAVFLVFQKLEGNHEFFNTVFEHEEDAKALCDHRGPDYFYLKCGVNENLKYFF